MSLVDPFTKSPFSISNLSKMRWIAEPRTQFLIKKARRAARRKDWSSACVFYARALHLTPNNGAVWVQLGHSLGQLGHAASAQIAYLNATRAEPQLAVGHKHLGLARYKTDLHEEAMQSLACALFLNPMDTEIRNLMTHEDEEAKVESLVGVAALTLADQHTIPAYIGTRATLLRAKARRFARRRQWVEAERSYRSLTRMRPHDAHAFIQLGHALNEQNKQKEAEHAYRCATAAAPLLPDAWLHLGYILTAQKRHLMAREAFAIVNRLAPARRAAHPILESADLAPRSHAHLADHAQDRRLVCPDGLGAREKAIWLRLAAHIESRH